MENSPIRSEDLSMLDIMENWPESLPVLMRFRMLCLGCSIAPFHNLRDACKEHSIDEKAFNIALDEAIAASALAVRK